MLNDVLKNDNVLIEGKLQNLEYISNAARHFESSIQNLSEIDFISMLDMKFKIWENTLQILSKLDKIKIPIFCRDRCELFEALDQYMFQQLCQHIIPNAVRDEQKNEPWIQKIHRIDPRIQMKNVFDEFDLNDEFIKSSFIVVKRLENELIKNLILLSHQDKVNPVNMAIDIARIRTVNKISADALNRICLDFQ